MDNFINVNNSHMPLMEYLEQRVDTFSMVDKAHRCPKDRYCQKSIQTKPVPAY